MQHNEQGRFCQLITDVLAFYRQDASEFAVYVWWQAMQPFDFAAVANALNRHCVDPDRGQFAPKPADVVRLLRGGSKDGSAMAWARRTSFAAWLMLLSTMSDISWKESAAIRVGQQSSASPICAVACFISCCTRYMSRHAASALSFAFISPPHTVMQAIQRLSAPLAFVNKHARSIRQS